jgi:hypothetical protein
MIMETKILNLILFLISVTYLGIRLYLKGYKAGKKANKEEVK